MPVRCRARIPRACVEYLLPCAQESACWARWLTAAFLSRKDLHQCSRADPDDVVLVVTELVTNVTRHTRSSCRLRLCADFRGLTVEVYDASPEWPCLRLAQMNEESGRGLMIVRALAQRLDVRAAPGGGKTVRATIRAPDAALVTDLRA
ncbi:ATP-binding protein [Streptomyces chrestomyceticus]|uniref:ATP-binding protein n=1 Tax=Streptomyces chrestomyceticus TaxID=68185 RepID=UPI0033F15D4A